MKNSIKRAQSQARLSFAERENFRPKVRQLKKTLLTLVALLAVTTGAWADETLLLTIESKDYTSFKSGSKTFDDKVTVTFSNEVSNNGNNNGWYTTSAAGPSLLTVAGINGYTITSCKFYTAYGDAANGYTVEGESPSVYLYGGNVYTDANQSVYIGFPGIKKIEVYGAAASSGPEVAWDKATKTGSFTMPAGNVTLEPEYYPQAALTAAPTAINDVPATTDGAIVEAGTVKNIGETTNAQGTVMYYVSQTALDDADLLALAADQWTADVPTAADLAQGEYHVYYYVRGNDSDTDDENFSDGDILAANALTVTIAAEPTYAVTFAEGVNPEPPAEPEWTASPAADVKKGQTVTVTYSGSKKVIGVKAEKKEAAGKTVDLSTYSGNTYEVTENVTFTGTTNNEISILYKGEGYEVTLDNVNAPKCYISAGDGNDNYTVNVKLKGTSRLAGIYGLNAHINIGEAAAGGTVILFEESPLGGSGATITINGGTVKAKTTAFSVVYSILEVNGGAVYIEAAEDNAAVGGSASGSVTLYGWNGSAWETYTEHRYLSTDNSKAPSEWTW